MIMIMIMRRWDNNNAVVGINRNGKKKWGRSSSSSSEPSSLSRVSSPGDDGDDDDDDDDDVEWVQTYLITWDPSPPLPARRPCNTGSHLWIGCHSPDHHDDHDGDDHDVDDYDDNVDDDGDNDQTDPAAAPSEGEARFLFWRIEISHELLLALTPDNNNLNHNIISIILVELPSLSANLFQNLVLRFVIYLFCKQCHILKSLKSWVFNEWVSESWSRTMVGDWWKPGRLQFTRWLIPSLWRPGWPEAQCICIFGVATRSGSDVAHSVFNLG